MSALSVKPASRADLDTMIGWAATEGWNPGHHDGDAFHRTDPEGFLIGWLDDEPVACISVVSYDDSFGFLGFYICRPEHRGRGHGLKVWEAGIDRLGDRTIGLDGVIDQQANYAKSGFVLAHRNIRYGGRVKTEAPADPHIVTLPAADADLVAYDAELFPVKRKKFLDHWVTSPGRRTLAWRKDGTIRGYGTIRPCREGHKIGPLFADTPAIAEALFTALAALHGDAPVFLDVPEPNRDAIALAERHGMKPVFETARMYRGPAPELPLDRIYGITTFELG
jgi:Acetyltransferase (GNAT) domain/Acetyltransferase (GNAT) family